jgi:tetratricopeptide (TPR) repeat protein
MSDAQNTNLSDDHSSKPDPGPDNSAADQLELKLPDESSAPRDLGLWAGVLMLLVLVVYWPATGGKFLWGDRHIVVDNQWVRHPGGLVDSWTRRWQNATYPFAMYQPMTATTYWLEYRFGGHADAIGPSPMPPEPTPLAFHLGNLIFHAIGAVLLWLLLREVKLPGAWVIAAIFALHPLNSEAVSWIANQSWPLAGMLSCGSVLLYLHFVKQRELNGANLKSGTTAVDPMTIWGLYIGSAVAFLLAMLANPAVLPLPVTLLLLLWWRDRLVKLDYTLVVPWLLIAGVLWLSNGSLVQRFSLWHQSGQAQLGAIGSGFLSCLLIFAPVSLKTFHTFEQSWLGIVALICWLGVSGLFWLNRERWGRGWFLASISYGLLQVFGLNWFDPLRRSGVTDSSSYLAGVAVIALVVSFIVSRLHQVRLPVTFPQLAVTASAVLLLIFGGVSWARSHVYDNPVSFWQDAVAKDPHSSLALSSLAEELHLRAIEEGNQGDTDGFKNDLAASLENAQAAVSADPRNGAAEQTWANVLVLRGDVKSALPHFQNAVDAQPNNLDLRLQYASGLDTIAMFKQAIPQADAALAHDSSSPIAHQLLGTAYGGLGDETRAIAELELALKLDPGNLYTRQILAEQQSKVDKLQDAIDNYSIILAQDADRRTHPDLFIAVAKLRERLYQWDQAVDWYKIALKLDPANPDVKAAITTDTIKAKAQAATRPTTRATTIPTTAPTSK